MESEDVARILNRGEGQRTEFKESFGAHKKAIESLGAFSNALGGTVIVGADNDGSVVGVDIGANTLENFANQIRQNSDPRLHHSVPGKQLLNPGNFRRHDDRNLENARRNRVC